MRFAASITQAVIAVVLSAVWGPAQAGPRDTALEAEDISVLRTAINGFLASPYGVPYNVSHGGVRMIVPDRTIRVCAPPGNSPNSYECIRSTDQQALDRLLTSDYGPDGAQAFRRRNISASVIRVQIDPQLRLVPAADLLEMLEGQWSEPFARRYPGAQGIVIVSAPTYPTPRRAAVYLLHVVRAAAYIDLVEREGVWTVRAVNGLWIS